ncbi:DUF3857 domain-containing protein [Hymenobacter caeli]|uniref:DUF3857 domain-containing protein n=1 Tax=Hymenobacter caeli TaxID=2735894 RepID=A0ABX2FL15_9BACT|nr:DUF3857 domain-containing protein [Hymenobacter caeli]NRT17210.1 hypothetical protein [Hymenobacter caeli]
MTIPLRPRRLALLAPALLSGLLAQAQPEPMKLGKPDPRDFQADAFKGDSAAAAVVLCDYGATRFKLNGTHFQYETDRVTRVKILKKAGYETATVFVPLYHRTGSEERLSGLRGTTYNMVGGQLQKTKLDAGTAFTEERTPNQRVRKFTLPDVREGAVIEYAYTVTSDFLVSLQDWTFQGPYPVRWSEYRAAIPEYFDYKMVMQGYVPLEVNTHEESSGQYTAHTDAGFDEHGNRESSGSGVITGRVTNYRWAMKDVPVLREEQFMTTTDDYVARLDFELAGERMPGQAYQPVLSTWEKINSELLADDDFGQQLGRGNFLKEQMVGLAAKYPDPAQRAAAVRRVVLAAVRYNGTNRYSTSGSLRKAYDAHSGTSADVNLLLIGALRTAGLKAHPVLLSTRTHGRVDQAFPLLTKFNYVIALVPLADGKELLVDATDPALPCGTLPERCLSQIGRLVVPEAGAGRWVDLRPTQRHVHFQQVQLALDAQGGLAGKVHEEYAGYAGADAREELAKLGEKKYLAEIGRQHTAWAVPTAAVLKRDDVEQPLALDYAFTQAPDDNAAAGTLYLGPLRDFAPSQNPFRHENRQYPVDFGAPQEEMLLVTLTLPEGYELAETPKGAVIDLPDDGGRYLYNVAAAGPTVQLTSRLTLRKPMYGAEEYAHLREFYRLMLEKQAEKLVIKKKA